MSDDPSNVVGNVAFQMEPILLNPEQAAVALAISPRMLWQMTKKGEIPCVRLGRSVRYSVTELRRWAAERATGGQSGD